MVAKKRYHLDVLANDNDVKIEAKKQINNIDKLKTKIK